MAPEEPGRREPEKEKERDKDRDGDVPPDEDEDPAATRRTHILEQVGPRVTPCHPVSPRPPVSRVPWWPWWPQHLSMALMSPNIPGVLQVLGGPNIS